MYGDATTPANEYGSQAGEAWAAGNTGSSTVYVGIIDEGAMFNHTDLAANFWTNQFDPIGGGDNDGNGYIDDTHGWDFAGNDNTVFDGTGDDHGTHVSGTIGAVGGNGLGVAGVTWNVKMISAKFLGATGGTSANAIKAVDYITDLKTRHGLNIVATNNSWGGGGFSQSLQDAITRAGAANILFIAAAGNDGLNTETTSSYPSGYHNENIIAVASITNTGSISSFSNYAATKVDIGAPGSAITSTLPAASGKGKNATITSSYGSYSGTSMATPHVTGGAALYAASHPGSSAATIKAAILNSAVATASLTGKCVTGGRLNVSGF
ncbi:MAG: S8 family peptidase [Chitinophagaceae bacterium]